MHLGKLAEAMVAWFFILMKTSAPSGSGRFAAGANRTAVLKMHVEYDISYGIM